MRKYSDACVQSRAVRNRNASSDATSALSSPWNASSAAATALNAALRLGVSFEQRVLIQHVHESIQGERVVGKLLFFAERHESIGLVE